MTVAGLVVRAGRGGRRHGTSTRRMADPDQHDAAMAVIFEMAGRAARNLDDVSSSFCCCPAARRGFACSVYGALLALRTLVRIVSSEMFSSVGCDRPSEFRELTREALSVCLSNRLFEAIRARALLSSQRSIEDILRRIGDLTRREDRTRHGVPENRRGMLPPSGRGRLRCGINYRIRAIAPRGSQPRSKRWDGAPCGRRRRDEPICGDTMVTASSRSWEDSTSSSTTRGSGPEGRSRP